MKCKCRDLVLLVYSACVRMKLDNIYWPQAERGGQTEENGIKNPDSSRMQNWHCLALTFAHICMVKTYIQSDVQMRTNSNQGFKMLTAIQVLQCDIYITLLPREFGNCLPVQNVCIQTDLFSFILETHPSVPSHPLKGAIEWKSLFTLAWL